MILMRIIWLVLRVHAVYPNVPIDHVIVAVRAAVKAETSSASAPLLVAIAQHESDLRPRAVSWRRGRRRVDRVVDNPVEIPARGPLACGLASSIAADRATCERLLDPTAAMLAAVAELTEELARCRGDVSCALSCYAGGRRGIDAWRAGLRTDATVFAAIFKRRAELLGARFARPAS